MRIDMRALTCKNEGHLWMLKIVHFGKYCSPITGGIESVTASLAKGVAAVGQQVSAVCFDKVSLAA